MSTKARLISTISAVCLILALLVTGVWAVSTANVTLGGTVSFIADNVNATVTGTITGTQESITLPDLVYKANTDTTSTEFQANVEKWSNNALTFTSDNEITMTITVTNNSTERSLFVKVTDNTTTKNIDKTFKANKGGITSGQTYELAVSDSITYEIKMSVHELNESASATYAYNVVLKDSHYTGSDEAEQNTISYKYTIENGEVYQTSYCLDCGVEGAKTKMATDSYVIATPETAQDILDSDINGKTVVFSAGTYSTDLEFRPTKATATVYTMNDDIFGAEYTGELATSTTYGYFREFSNITFTAVEGATFTKMLVMEGGLGNNFVTNRYDAVKELYVSESANYFRKYDFVNVTFNGLKFEGARGRMYFAFGGLEVTNVSDIKFENCSFETEEIENKFSGAPQREASIYFVPNGVSDNVIFRNNYSSGHYQGIYVQNVENSVFESNTITNTSHNAIAIQSADPMTERSYISGLIDIKNNTIENTGDRAIRFGIIKNGTINMENNTFVDAIDADGELLKTQASTGLNYNFKSNTHNTVALEDVSGTIEQWIITVTV